MSSNERVRGGLPTTEQGDVMGDVQEELKRIPGIRFVDHVAIAVKQGELETQVKAYEMLGFREIHREEVRGGDQVREALLQIGEGPNLIQLLEPLSPDSPVQKLIDRPGVPRGEATASRIRDEYFPLPEIYRDSPDLLIVTGLRSVDRGAYGGRTLLGRSCGTPFVVPRECRVHAVVMPDGPRGARGL